MRAGELFWEGSADVLFPGRELPGLDVEQLDVVVGEHQDTTNRRGRGGEGMAGSVGWWWFRTKVVESRRHSLSADIMLPYAPPQLEHSSSDSMSFPRCIDSDTMHVSNSEPERILINLFTPLLGMKPTGFKVPQGFQGSHVPCNVWDALYYRSEQCGLIMVNEVSRGPHVKVKSPELSHSRDHVTLHIN
ncbi:hypothetical protein B0H14DRAFT_2608942 [Mycena olivaceomarginata]|nr:hypothetical protein B0H14DRAFT_2608942 [Mycena olivaceomarginata]